MYSESFAHCAKEINPNERVDIFISARWHSGDVHVFSCAYLSAANPAYYWVNRPNIFMHSYDHVIKDLLWF